MGIDFYRRNNEHFRPYKKIITVIDKISAYYVFLSFIILVIILCFTQNQPPFKLLLCNAAPFLLLSGFRNLVSAKRPYEVYEIKPILDKDTKGKSFPSRHVFSAFLIGTTTFAIIPIYSVSVLITGIIISITRVIGGVHFVRDVLTGMSLGILFGYIGILIQTCL